MATSVPLGIVSLKAEGAYAADKLYKKGMWVTSSGSSYAYINPTPAAGVPLTDTTHWQQIASVGGQDLVDAAVAARDAAQGYKDAAANSAAQLAAGTASPAGTYANLAALIADDPDHSKIYITLDDGNWCYHNGSAFVAGGTYQAVVGESIDLIGKSIRVINALPGNGMTLKVSAKHTQAGSGEPSFDNARPIVGEEEITVIVSDGKSPDTQYKANLDYPLFGFDDRPGDFVDFKTGIIKKRTGQLIYTGIESYTVGNYSSENSIIAFPLPDNYAGDIICSHAKLKPFTYETDVGYFSVEGAYIKFVVEKSKLNNPANSTELSANFKIWARAQFELGIPLQFVYSITSEVSTIETITKVQTVLDSSKGFAANYAWNAINPNMVFTYNIGATPENTYLSQFTKVNSVASSEPTSMVYANESAGYLKICIAKTTINNPTDNATAVANFKAWLDAQVLAGTPVTLSVLTKVDVSASTEAINVLPKVPECFVSDLDNSIIELSYLVPLYQLSKSTILFSGNTVTKDSPICLVKTGEHISLRVTELVRTKLYPLVSNDGITWTALPVKNEKTGETRAVLFSSGDYTAPIYGYTYFKLYSKPDSLAGSRYSGRKSTAYLRVLRTTPQDSLLPVYPRTTKQPINLNPDWKLVTDRNHFSPTPGAVEGTVYYSYGNIVFVTPDNGDTFTFLFTLGGAEGVKQLKYLSDDTLVVFSTEGKIYKTDTSKTTFSHKHTFKSTGTAVSYSFGVHAYDNIIVCNEYGGQTGANNARHAYISTDYGNTWSDLFEGRLGTDYYFHLHDVHYDPYSQIIWMTNGDTANNANIRWSTDMGATWNSVWEYGDCPKQFTSIAALPNCVLFLTDSIDVAVWRWNRLTNPLTNGTKLEIEPAYTVYNDYPANEPIGAQMGVSYGADAVVYLAWQFYDVDSILMPARIFGTTDGYIFHVIWQANSSPEQSGIMCISNPTIDGNILATYKDAANYNLLKVDNPGWK